MNNSKSKTFETFVDAQLNKSIWLYKGKRIEPTVIRVMGLKSLAYANKLLIPFWLNVTVYIANYFGIGSSIDYDMIVPFNSIRSWMVKVKKKYYTHLPRHMKHTLAFLENCIGDTVEDIDSGAATRHDALMIFLQ